MVAHGQQIFGRDAWVVTARDKVKITQDKLAAEADDMEKGGYDPSSRDVDGGDVDPEAAMLMASGVGYVAKGFVTPRETPLKLAALCAHAPSIATCMICTDLRSSGYTYRLGPEQ